MWQVVGWICAVVAVSCKPMPDVATIQSAYDREASSGSAQHDKGLQILQAKCLEGSAGFLCDVTFTSKGDPADRLYFDVVQVARAGDGWELKSGLCKH